MSFLDAFKRRIQQTPGFAGDTLEDQLERERQAQTLTPQNQEAITRPRRVNDPLATPSFRDAFNRQPVGPTFDGKPIIAPQLNGEPFGTRDRRTQPRDYVADDAQYLRDLQNKPRNWKDKTLDVIDAVNTGLGNKPRTTMSKRERELAQAQQQLGMDLSIGKQQAQTAMEEVTLENGQKVLVPAKQAGTLQSRQQEIGVRGDTLTARKDRWSALNSNERRKTIIAEYKAGLLNNDPAALEQAAKELNIPGTLLPAFIGGQMRDAIDDEGNLIQVNRQTGEVTPTGKKSFEIVKEAGRNRRVQVSQDGQDRRKAMTPPRPRGQATDRVSARKAAALVGRIETARKAMADADAILATNPNNAAAKQTRQNAQQQGEGWAAELNALGAGYEAGAGDKGYPYYKQNGQPANPGGQYAGRRISQSKIPEFAKRHKMTTEEAVEYLKSNGAVIY